MFHYICSLVKDDLLSNTGNFMFSNGLSLSLHDQVAVVLRRLSTGDSLIMTGDFFGVGHSMVFQVTWRFIEALEEKAHHHVKWPSTTERNEESEIQIRGCLRSPQLPWRNRPHAHCNQLLTKDPNASSWLDEQDNYSVVLQAITSHFNQLCEKITLLCEQVGLPDGTNIRDYVTGDSDYPLLPHLITPYRGRDVSGSKLEFNRRHGKAIAMAQRALTELKDNWRIIKGVMWRPDRHRLSRVILACCLLHNIGIDIDNGKCDRGTVSGAHDPGYDQRLCPVVDEGGESLREKLCPVSSGRL
ncbi:hypothetical protein MLD38_003987 [Melastoma candidum]|uniref:Uncharacterized protein n=1 Tax=Melastoma candidum TaxID=119954 RepID=A0ACB9S3I3_9MYRT|nr:hypothetical protein MLD38_003987 [Melastoma candidum]